MDPKKLQAMLKQLGMKMEDVPASRVTIKADSGDIVIDNPQVIKTTMKGQVIYQVSGKTTEKTFTDDDVKLVVEQTGERDEEKIKKILQETNGDVVGAIMKLKK